MTVNTISITSNQSIRIISGSFYFYFLPLPHFAPLPLLLCFRDLLSNSSSLEISGEVLGSLEMLGVIEIDREVLGSIETLGYMEGEMLQLGLLEELGSDEGEMLQLGSVEMLGAIDGSPLGADDG
jgi:hypothetical protein